MHRKEDLSGLTLARFLAISLIFPVVGIFVAFFLMKKRNLVLGRGGTQGVLALSDLMRSDERFRGQLVLKWISDRVQKDRGTETLIKASVQPEIDLAFHKDIEIRKRAVMKLSESRKPRRLQVLRSALRDPSNEVRTLAGIVLARTEQNFVDEVESTSVLSEKIQLRVTRVASGFLVGSLRQRELSQAQNEVEQLLMQFPLNADAHHMHARICFLKEDFRAALTHFEKAIALKGGRFTRSQGFVLECWFRLGMWKELKEFCQGALSDQETVPPILYRSIEYWGRA